MGKKGQREAEQGIYRQGEKPNDIIDYPVDAADFEVVDIFNWQGEAAGMISQMELVRRATCSPRLSSVTCEKACWCRI